MKRLFRNILSRDYLHDIPEVHDSNLMGKGTDQSQVMADKKHADVFLLLETYQKPDHGLLYGNVKCRGSLIAHQDLRFQGKCPGNTDTLTLSATHVMWIAAVSYTHLQGLMDRVNQIWNHPLYQNELNKLQLLETDREFCRHTPEHFLDVARLAYIRALEENAPVSKELIYCTALLHDIGRARQYEDGTPHDEAGAAIAGQILNELGFSMEEMEAIIAAIRGHRAQTDPTVLGKLLYTADKSSRNCFSCKAEPECYWSPAKKNMTIQY